MKYPKLNKRMEIQMRSTRVYQIEYRGNVERFTSHRAAGARYRRMAKAGYYVTATTWREYGGGRERLDSTGNTPEWAWNPKFKY